MILTLIVRSRLFSSTMLPFLAGSVARVAASGSGNRPSEALCGSGPGLGGLGGAVPSGRRGDQAIDQNASRLTKPCPFAQLTRPLAFEMVKISVDVSLTPIIGVMPMLSPVWLCVFVADCSEESSMLPPLSLAEPMSIAITLIVSGW